jgi:S-(hydroxymethyl)glutathione dehydrogenase/alcohol dehydrogenase
VKPGDHVIACLSVFCGTCDFCLSGKPNLCQDPSRMRAPGDPPKYTWNGNPVHQFINISSYAEFMLLHENAVVKIRDDMPLDRAALIGCGVMTGTGAVLNTAKVEPGSSVAVFGAGGVGSRSWQPRSSSVRRTSSTHRRATPCRRSRT